jgi:hypothetical protein
MALLALLAATAALALVASGCGGSSSQDDSLAQAAPPASDFPKPTANEPLIDLLQKNAKPVDLVVAPAQQVLRTGKNRFAFGVFNVDRSQVTDAKVALYAAPGPAGKGPAIGPFPARIDSLTTEAAYHSKTTADDPAAALAAYVTDIPFDKPGQWTIAAIVKKGDSNEAVFLPDVAAVGAFPGVPKVGDKAPVVDTDTASSVGDPKLLDTRVPPDTMHNDNFADVVGKKPVVLLFASPALCVSRTCGPVADVTEQVKQQFGDKVAFIHQEPYADNNINKGLRQPAKDFNLPGEPWVFVIDRNGVISSEIEGPFGVDELTSDVEKVAG